MWRIRLTIANLVLFHMHQVQGTSEIQSQRQEVYCAFFGSHTFAPISWMCKKQTAVSHSSAESEQNSLDTGARLDGLPALQFGKCVLETLSSKRAKGNLERHTRERVIPSPSHSDIVFLSHMTRFHPTFPTVHTRLRSAYSKTSRQ